MYNSIILVYSQLYNHQITTINFRTFSSYNIPKKSIFINSYSLSTAFWPKQPLTSFVSQSCLFCTFHINGIIKYVVFWLFLLSMFSRFIHAATYLSTLFLFYGQIRLHCMDIQHCIHSSIGPLACFYFCGVMNNAAINTRVLVFEQICFQLSWVYIVIPWYSLASNPELVKPCTCRISMRKKVFQHSTLAQDMSHLLEFL